MESGLGQSLHNFLTERDDAEEIDNFADKSISRPAHAGTKDDFSQILSADSGGNSPGSRLQKQDPDTVIIEQLHEKTHSTGDRFQEDKAQLPSLQHDNRDIMNDAQLPAPQISRADLRQLDEEKRTVIENIDPTEDIAKMFSFEKETPSKIDQKSVHLDTEQTYEIQAVLKSVIQESGPPRSRQ